MMNNLINVIPEEKRVRFLRNCGAASVGSRNECLVY